MRLHLSPPARLPLYLLLLVPSHLVMNAQSAQPAGPAKTLAFEVADVHRSPYVFTGRYFRIAPPGGNRFVAHQATLLDLVSTAYGIEQDAVVGGPPWLAFDRYDIVAKVPPGTTRADTNLMLRSLLADRFKLVIQPEMKSLPAFLLKVGKGAPKLRATEKPATEGGCTYQAPDPPPPPNTPPPPIITLKCSNMTMDQFTKQLQLFGTLNHPVVDATDLKEGRDFEFVFSWQTAATGIFDSVEKLGLKLEAGSAPRQAMVIMSWAEAPTANVAGIEMLVPPSPPPSFEVAVIRPSQQESKDLQIRFNGGNQLTFSTTLLGFIGYAWGISTTTVISAPAFVDNQVWEITAKLPVSDAPPPPRGQPRVDFDEIRLMMRSLLSERFGLKTRNAEEPGNGYTLLAASPKLKKADPANRSSCDRQPPPGEKDPRLTNPSLTSYMHCQNVTIDQFAQELQGYAMDTIKTPIRNATDIAGRFDISLSFSSIRALGSSPPTMGTSGAGGAGTGAANVPASVGATSSDPVGVAISLQDALQKQLGLKLQLQKRPVAALVVVHLDEKPTPN